MSTALARKFRADLTSDLTLGTGWLQLNGIFDFKPVVSPKTIDTSAYDTNGWDSNTVISNGWSVAADCWRRTTAGVYDPGQELARARVGQSGDASTIGVRWYDKNGGPESFRGVAVVAWARSKTGVADGDAATITMTGTDQLYTPANPGVAALAPVILSALPSGVAVGGLVTITGAGFTGTIAVTGVTFDAVDATTWVVVSDSVIVAEMPTGTAGVGNIVVTNAAGASTAFAYTRA